ncbi:MAG: prephenate dehydratase domain-containing protein [Oscillospiraceae bacterium]
MDELVLAREEIDEIDGQMAVLFQKRMTAVKRVALYKKANGKAVLDSAREELVVQKNLKRLDSEEQADLYEQFIRKEMELSRAYQMRVLHEDVVAYQGAEGAFSHIALTRLYPNATQKRCETFEGVFEAVENGEAAFGVLPFENSFAGDVSEVLDLCFAHSLVVRAVYDLPVTHNLLAQKGAQLSDIKDVYSHAQAISQCSRFLSSMNLSFHEYANTALAAQYVAQTQDKTKGAIASLETAKLYGLEVLVKDINTSADNTTRFIVVGRTLMQSGNRFELLFTVEHRAGSLAQVVETIAEKGFNLECIKSRPMPKLAWQYYFYAELVGDAGGAAGKDLIDALEKICKKVRLLGVYQK